MEKIFVFILMATGLLYFHFYSRQRIQNLFNVKQVQKFKETINTMEYVRNDNLFKTLAESNLYPLTGISEEFLITENVKDLADEMGLYDYIDMICACQIIPDLQRQTLQRWYIYPSVLICTDDTGHIVLKQFLKKYNYACDGLQFYFVNNVILTPSEYGS